MIIIAIIIIIIVLIIIIKVHFRSSILREKLKALYINLYREY